MATLSSAPEVGIDLATPVNPLFGKTAWALAASTATESEGVTKNYLPKIMFLSASPSQAAPKSGTSFASLFFAMSKVWTKSFA